MLCLSTLKDKSRNFPEKRGSLSVKPILKRLKKKGNMNYEIAIDDGEHERLTDRHTIKGILNLVKVTLEKNPNVSIKIYRLDTL
jgi:hypothetical protein